MPDSSALSTATSALSSPYKRRLPVGAEYQGASRTHVRVWAPAVERAAVIVDGARTMDLASEGGGYFSALVDAAPGARYQFRLGSDDRLYPDPASRFQPDGPHGPSEIVDPAAFVWSDAYWNGVTMDGQVAYSMH